MIVFCYFAVGLRLVDLGVIRLTDVILKRGFWGIDEDELKM